MQDFSENLDLRSSLKININYNFDFLIEIIEGLVESHKYIGNKLEEQEVINNEKNLIIENLNSKLENYFQTNIEMYQLLCENNKEKSFKIEEILKRSEEIENIKNEKLSLKLEASKNNFGTKKPISNRKYKQFVRRIYNQNISKTIVQNNDTENKIQKELIEKELSRLDQLEDRVKKRELTSNFSIFRNKSIGLVGNDIANDFNRNSINFLRKDCKSINFDQSDDDVNENQTENWINILNNPNKLSKKLISFENQLSEIFSIKNDLFEIKSNLKPEFILKNQEKLTGAENVSFEEKLNTLSNNVNDINSKLNELNFFDLSKNKVNSLTNNAEMNHFIQNFEKKIYKKLEIVDEKFIGINDEFYKLKNENLVNKSALENLNKSIQNKLNDFEILQKNYTLSQNEMNEKFQELVKGNEINNIYQPTININSEKDENIKSDDKLRLDNESFIQEPKAQNSDNEQTTKLLKKFNEIEKKITNQSSKIDQRNSEIKRIQEQISEKVLKIEFLELREIFNQTQNQIGFLKDTITQLLEDRQIIEEFNQLRKKFDEIALTNNSPKKSFIDISNSPSKNQISSRFVDWPSFKEFIRLNRVELDDLILTINDNKNSIEELQNSVSKKSSLSDFNLLEKFVLNKFEEFKIANVKRFADRTETNKNIKFLDSQIKNILDTYIKKLEKGDNWLLAKKNVSNGNYCASCESYIGDLNENHQHIPWNKMNQDRVYRVGSGFSRMLQMINLSNDAEKIDELNTSKVGKKGMSKVKSMILKDTGFIEENEKKNEENINEMKNSNNIMMPKVVKVEKKKEKKKKKKKNKKIIKKK